MGGARRGVGIAQPVQLRLNPNLLSGAISPGRTSITPWAWPVGCADRSGFGRYQPGETCNPRSASKPTYMLPRDNAGATPAGGDNLQQEGYTLKHCLIGGALGASAALAVMAAVSMRQWNVAFYWVIVAAYWALRLWEELR